MPGDPLYFVDSALHQVTSGLLPTGEEDPRDPIGMWGIAFETGARKDLTYPTSEHNLRGVYAAGAQATISFPPGASMLYNLEWIVVSMTIGNPRLSSETRQNLFAIDVSDVPGTMQTPAGATPMSTASPSRSWSASPGWVGSAGSLNLYTIGLDPLMGDNTAFNRTLPTLEVGTHKMYGYTDSGGDPGYSVSRRWTTRPTRPPHAWLGRVSHSNGGGVAFQLAEWVSLFPPGNPPTDTPPLKWDIDLRVEAFGYYWGPGATQRGGPKRPVGSIFG